MPQTSPPALPQVVPPKLLELGGLPVRRLLPRVGQHSVGPWLFFDHMGPFEFAAGHGVNVLPHPHINLATVTYLFSGELLHRDSIGSKQVICPGDVNLMVAGRGIVHSERQRPEYIATPHRLDGLQLWLALPEADEEMEPAFFHIEGEQIPQQQVQGVTVNVLIGEAYGLQSPVPSYARTLYLEAYIPAGKHWSLPAETERAVYVVDGELQLQRRTGESLLLPRFHLAVLPPDSDWQLLADQNAHVVLIGGEPLGKRHMDWNFVSSQPERIAQAKQDWQAQRFAKVVGDEHEFIPLPQG